MLATILTNLWNGVMSIHYIDAIFRLHCRALMIISVNKIPPTSYNALYSVKLYIV